MSTNQKIVLGNIVRDPVTGIQGTAVSIVEVLSGSVQVGLQPKTEGKEPGKMIDAFNHDINLLEFVDNGLADKITPAQEVHISLGDEVEDMVSGIRGIATQRVTFMNGCVYFVVQPRAKDPKKAVEAPATISAFYSRLKVRKAGAFKPQGPARTKTETVEKRPGGPITSALRQ